MWHGFANFVLYISRNINLSFFEKGLNFKKGLEMSNFRIIKNSTWRERYLKILKSEKPLNFVHIDTTGLSADDSDIIGISILKSEFKDGRLVKKDALDTLIYTNKFITPKVTELSGITHEMVKSAPPAEVVMEKVREFLGDKAIVIGFNTPFIGSFLKPYKLPIAMTLDLNVVSRALFSGNSGYGFLSKEFETKSPARIFEGLMDKVPEGTKQLKPNMMKMRASSSSSFRGLIGDCEVIISEGKDRFGEYIDVTYNNRALFEDFSPETLMPALNIGA